MVDKITGVEYFKNPTTELSSDYDFNGDGTVDIVDYNLATVYLSDTDPTNDVDFTQEELDNVFAALIDEENKNQNYDTINEENAYEIAKQVIAEIKSDANNPIRAKKLNELQIMGQNLSKYMKECSDLLTVYATKIEKLEAELHEVEAEKAEKEEQYGNKTEEVEELTAELNQATYNILRKTNKMEATRSEQSREIVKNCIKLYSEGKYPNETLQSLIASRLAEIGGFDVQDLQNEVAHSTALGSVINSLCTQINGIMSEIVDVNGRYNTINANYTTSVEIRNSLVTSAQDASKRYQTGYQQRIDLRDAIIENYKVEGNGACDTTNEQVAMLNNFLNASELDDMPYSDAWVVLKEAFGNCGLKFDEENYELSIPTGNDELAMHIYDGLAQSIEDNYGIKPKRYDSTTGDDVTDPDVVDPEEYDGKVYIVTAYNNTWFSAKSKHQLTLGDNVLDFCSKTKKRGKHFTGSKKHNDNTANDAEWQALYAKMPDEVKNLPLTNGQAYLLTEDGQLLGTASSDQIAAVNYKKNSKFRASENLANANFQVTADLGITSKKKASGEEGSGGKIVLDGKEYDVAQTIFRKKTPLVLDLKGDGLKNTNVDNGVNFDLNADGTMDRTAWTAAQSEFDNAFLVLDKNGDGQINDGSELFGDQNGAENGFAELSKYDSNNDGKVDESDDAYSQMQLWCDMNADGKVDDGELKGLKEMGVAELSVDYDKVTDENGKLVEDEFGNTTGLQGGFTRADGTKGQMTDVLFNNIDLDDYNANKPLSKAAEVYFENNLFADEVVNFQPDSLGERYTPIETSKNIENFIDTAEYTIEVKNCVKEAENIFSDTIDEISNTENKAENNFFAEAENVNNNNNEDDKEKEKLAKV